MNRRLAILASHPIHYQAPLWRLLAADPELEVKVFFQNDTSLKPHRDPEFGRVIEWDLPLAEGYPHEVLSGPLELIWKLRRGRYDALLVHAWNSPTAWIAVTGAKALGLKTLLRAESPWNQEAARSGPRHVLKRKALGLFFGMTDAFLYIGEENRQFYLHHGIPERRLFFTPYAIENDRFFEEERRLRPERKEIRTRLGLPHDAVVFLAVGKLIEKKRHMDLLRAYEKCAAPNKALVIVGEGNLRGELEQYIEKRGLADVQLPGFIGQTQIAPYYIAADVFVLPSGPGETWGLVVNEAMCFGLPVVVSDMIGSARDLVHPGRNGHIFPLGNTDALARALEELARDPEKRQNFGKRSLGLVREYSYEADARGIKKALS